MTPTPVLLVHGIWDSARRLEPLRAGLVARGVASVHAMDLTPNTGAAPIATLSAQVDAKARSLAADGALDVVGFSMGALVARHWIQRGGGRDRVRRFVSLSGPHHGTLTAHALPLDGARDMRPRSALLRDLAADADPFGAVEVHCLYTPFDVMVTPARTAVLPGARSVTAVPVALHRFMITDPRVLDRVAAILRG